MFALLSACLGFDALVSLCAPSVLKSDGKPCIESSSRPFYDSRICTTLNWQAEVGFQAVNN